jgi:hypothetical protein
MASSWWSQPSTMLLTHHDSGESAARQGFWVGRFVEKLRRAVDYADQYFEFKALQQPGQDIFVFVYRVGTPMTTKI